MPGDLPDRSRWRLYSVTSVWWNPTEDVWATTSPQAIRMLQLGGNGVGHFQHRLSEKLSDCWYRKHSVPGRRDIAAVQNLAPILIVWIDISENVVEYCKSLAFIHAPAHISTLLIKVMTDGSLRVGRVLYMLSNCRINWSTESAVLTWMRNCSGTVSFPGYIKRSFTSCNLVAKTITCIW